MTGSAMAGSRWRGCGGRWPDGRCRAGRTGAAGLAGRELPGWPDGRIRLAADVSNWLRPDAATSPERLFCHC
ncbi:MAG TPA: hypothetical protein VKV80_07980 [Streptosporangiaceae bacterium]|nr:hypothetical protein [Streptosporangiaceae bacterium]